jgi:hypothetical protein
LKHKGCTSCLSLFAIISAFRPYSTSASSYVFYSGLIAKQGAGGAANRIGQALQPDGIRTRPEVAHL